MSDFEVEHTPTKTHHHYSPSSKSRRHKTSTTYESEVAYRASISRLIVAKARPFSVSGRIPFDPVTLTLFFRSKSGITHSLDFPIDIDHDMPPALDVLISSCRPHSPPGLEDFSAHDSLFYPANLSLTTSLEIANHPILDAVRDTLFPTLPTGHYVTAIRDKLEIWLQGNGMKVQARPNDSRVATIFVTLPVRYRGGGLVVRNPDGMEERYYGNGSKTSDMEWTAVLSDCDHEIEPVMKGCRMTISYAVHLKTFGASGIQPDPLIAPSDQFLDTLSPILNMSRGRKIAFHLTGDYQANPSEVLAESLVPELTGGDSLLYHALKIYKLAPELRWIAGGYVWAVDQVVDLSLDDVDDSPPMSGMRLPFSVLNGVQSAVSPIRSSYGSRSGSDIVDDAPVDDLRTRVKRSGALSFAEADIVVLSDTTLSGLVSKARVPFVQGGEMERLVVHVLMVVYVP
ncbi:hypothetical protein C8Q75DRAFT_712221 [Abortiporus biennis]|nr:hypothetical protein C8Q75DRAFT_712221 [Abortiporus biennis]